MLFYFALGVCATDMQTRLFYLAVALLFSLVSAQTLEEKVILDAFTVETETLVIITPAGGVTPETAISQTSITQGTSILGGERDLQLTAEKGANQVFSASVGGGVWNVNTPNSGSGYALMQYDGADNSLQLNLSSLNANLREGGADRIRTLVECDIPTVVRISIFEGSTECFLDQEIQGNQGVIQEFFWNYSAFSGSCTFSNVNAVEILIEAFDNVDILFRFFGTYGPPLVVSPSPSPSPVVNPPPPAVCTCNCPQFVCGIIFKGPSDDDDSIDDDNDDDEIVFRPVYYGPVDDDFDKIDGDDDDYEWLSFRGGLTINHQDDDDDLHDTPSWSLPTTFADDDETVPIIGEEEVSSSSLLSVSLMVIGAAVILF